MDLYQAGHNFNPGDEVWVADFTNIVVKHGF